MNGFAWWQRGVIYQVYTRSFQDGDGDGVGDLAGLIGRLDYLEWLGVDAIWVCSVFPSPQADFGYDVTDHCGVDPRFGTPADLDELLRQAHARGIRVILDWIPNHTSDRHPWFLASRSARDDPRRDWYLWRDPKPDGGPPTNWVSLFGGSAWRFDPATGQSYLHTFLPEQPDLNWRHPAVRAVMFDVARFWLDRGVDGFRVDAFPLVVKDDQYRDNPPNPRWSPAEGPYRRLLPLYTAERPEMREVVRQIRGVLDAYEDRVLLAEVGLPLRRAMAYYGVEGRGVHLPFNFALIDLPWDARAIAAFVSRYEAALPPGAWPNWVLGNHDRSRVATRLGPAQARVAAVLLLTLRGTPTLYYGDELGMGDVPIPPERVRDPLEARVPGQGRDPQRTPMRWDASPRAGFTSGDPWLPIGDDHRATNVAAERGDPRSTLSLYRRLIALRRAEPALAVGAYEAVPAEGAVLAYVRSAPERRYLILLNLGNQPQRVVLPDHGDGGRVAVATRPEREGEQLVRAVSLAAAEGLVARLEPRDGTGLSPARR